MINLSISIVILNSSLIIYINFPESTLPDLSVSPPIATKASTYNNLYYMYHLHLSDPLIIYSMLLPLNNHYNLISNKNILPK